MDYLQQPPSQQAGLPQQATVVAACADSEIKRTAANAKTSALSFIKMISLKNAVIDIRAADFRRARKRKSEERMIL
jgi:hypothetical protein